MGKDKKKKRVKKALNEMTYTASPLGPAARGHIETTQTLTSRPQPSVTLEFDYFGTRYKGIAYPVGETPL